MHALAVQSGLSLFSSTHCLSRVIQPAITPWLLQFLHDRTLGLRTAGRSPRAASSSPLAQPTEACGLVIAIWGLSWRVQPLVTRLAKQPIPTAMDLGRMFISTCSSAQFGRSQLGFWGSLTVVVQPAGIIKIAVCVVLCEFNSDLRGQRACQRWRGRWQTE